MTDVGRRKSANHQKIQEAAKKQAPMVSSGGSRVRQSPAGRRLAALRKKKEAGETD